MNLSFFIAKRYLFSKKNRNAINIISVISVIVVAVATAALIIILSVMNGFDVLIHKSINSLTSDIQITVKKEKTFSVADNKFAEIKKMKDVAYFSEILEENVLIKSKNKQTIAVLKGVSNNYAQMNRIDTLIYQGEFKINDNQYNYAVFGIGIAWKAGISVLSQHPVSVWLPNRKKININNPENSFNRIFLFPSGTIYTEQEFDEKYIIASINCVRNLTERDSNIVNAIEIKIANTENIEKVKNEIQKILGSDFSVKNRYEQNNEIYKIVSSEKNIAFIILLFIVLIASFSMIASMTMLIIEKQKDIKTLQSMGANLRMIKKIFITQGRLITLTGASSGVLLGFIVTFLQEHYKLIRFPEGNYILDAYPVSMNPVDFILTFVSVNLIGFIVTLYPVFVMRKRLFNV